MCVVSAMGQQFDDRWRPLLPTTDTYTYFGWATEADLKALGVKVDKLRIELELIVDLLRAAKIYDIEHDEPDCEKGEKVELIKRLCDVFGIDLEDVFDA